MTSVCHSYLRIRLFLQLRDGGGFESVADQLVNNA
jgi:hypothetical protein